MKKTLFLCFSLLLCLSLLLPVSAGASPTTPYGITVLDRADLFTEEEESFLETKQGGDIRGVRFFVVTNPTPLSSNRVADLCGVDGEMPAVILAIDISGGTYYYEMFTFNDADDMFSNRDVNAILDADSVYGNIKSGNLSVGCASFFDGCQSVIEQAPKKRAQQAVIIGLVVGALAGGGAVLGVFLSYRKKRHGASYPLDRYANLRLTESQDRFVGSYVTRVRVQSNSGGGRAGGGGGHRSGGSRGRR